MDNIEILSPAGSFEALKSAVDSGADAVYFGGKAFSARKNAVNLSDEEIKEAVSYAHLRGAKLYAAVNTLVFDSELEPAYNFIRFCYEAGVDALIIQDLGLVRLVKKYFPDFPLHASTQMTIHNLSGALAAQKNGFKRVVLSREISLDEIRHIADNTDIELEVFVHGALCMSYSGQCLMSSFLGGRSGNRGACAQPCRLPYTLLDKNNKEISPKEKYLLSLKDMCLIDYIADLKNAGVTSLKIEGRMKSAAYVSAVTGIYNKYRSGGKVSKEDMSLLQNIFSRGAFTDSYLKGENGRHMLSFEKNHDDIFSSATDEVIEDAKSLASLNRKSYIDAVFTMKMGEPVCFEARYMGKSFFAVGETVAREASNMPVDAQRIEQQLKKLGSTVLDYQSLKVNAEDGLYIPIKEINSVRRKVCDEIEALILGGGRVYKGEDFSMPPRVRTDKINPSYSASVLSKAQADKCYELGFERIYIPYALYLKHKEEFDKDADIYSVKLAPINHDRLKRDYSNIALESCLVTNIGQTELLPEGIKKYGDYRLNACNSLATRQLSAMGLKSICLSAEMTITQMQPLYPSISAEILVYGRTALMTVKNCLVKSSLEKCGCSDELYYLRDRKNICFPVECIKGECINIIYNSAPIYMADRLKELQRINASFYRFDFTDESPDKIENIVASYEKGNKSKEFFTRGHYYNGI